MEYPLKFGTLGSLRSKFVLLREEPYYLIPSTDSLLGVIRREG